MKNQKERKRSMEQMRSERVNEEVLTIGDVLDNFIFKGRTVVISNGEVKLEEKA